MNSGLDSQFENVLTATVSYQPLIVLPIFAHARNADQTFPLAGKIGATMVTHCNGEELDDGECGTKAWKPHEQSSHYCDHRGVTFHTLIAACQRTNHS